MSRSVLNDNFNRKHGEILDTAQDLEPVSIRFNPFQSVPVPICFNPFQSLSILCFTAKMTILHVFLLSHVVKKVTHTR